MELLNQIVKKGNYIMSSKIKKLYSDKVIKNIEPFICENIQYETIMGSTAYGVSSQSSDVDLYAFTIPPKGYVFPHTEGYIPNFGSNPPNFNVFQQHHIKQNDNEYDVAVYSIVKYFSLLMDNNPNLIDSLFTREQSVTYSSKIGQMVKDKRHIFLHKGSWHRFRGYAYAQMKRMNNKIVEPGSKRYNSIMRHGYDVKHAYHIIRLLDEVEQILSDQDIDLMKNNDQLISIRNGEWYLDDIKNYFYTKEKRLEQLYQDSSLQKYPDEGIIKQLLLDCLEEFYGSIGQDEVRVVSTAETTLKEIKKLVNKYD